MTTFAAYSMKRNLPVVSYASYAEGTLENIDGVYRFTHIVLKPTIVVEAESFIAEATKILHEAHRDCFIANSIRGEVTIEPNIIVSEESQ